MIIARGLGGRLIEQGYGGPLEYVVVISTVPDATFENVFIVLNRQNSYTGVQITLNTDWANYLAVAPVTTYFTVKERWVDALEDALIDNVGTVQAENILFNLSVNDTNITEKDYWWQMQVRNTNGEVVKIPIGGQLAVDPVLRKVEPVAP